MIRNPALNALAALLYIRFIASVMYFFSRFVSAELPFMIPIAILSLFTLSAAVMGYIFLVGLIGHVKDVVSW